MNFDRPPVVSTPSEQAKPKKSEGDDPKKRDYVAERATDGKQSRSTAVYFTDEETISQLDAGFAAEDRRKQEERKKRLTIPEDVKPGTSTMVSVNLGNAIFLNEEAFEKAKGQSQVADERKAGLLEGLRLQHWLLREVRHMPGYFGNDSAADIADGVEHLIGQYEKRRGKGAENILLAEVPYKKYASI